MNNCFPLDFIRQIIEQTLLEQKLIAPTDYFGGKNEVNLFSFYEQLQKDSEVNRYVEIYQDLVEQQNRSGLIMNGTIIAPENPTITNLYLDTIIPMSFTCSFRVTLGDRDKAITTINNLIEKLKGRKQDVALFENGQIFKVGTICNQFAENENGLQTHSGDYIGEWDEDFDLDTYIDTYIATDLDAKGIWLNNSNYVYYYLSRSESGGLIVAKRVPIISGGTTTYHWRRVFEGESGTEDILFPPEGDFEKYKVSMSFDSIRCDEPRNLNAKEYCTISFGGSATLVNNGVALGNDLVKLGISKNKIIASPNIIITPNENLLSNATWLEPLEMPSGNSANTITNLLNSNRFNTNSHTTNITIANQYSFVLDRSIPLLDQLYKYGRYGYFGVDNSGETPSYTNAITPNMIFRVYEVNSSWGDVDVNFIDAKIVEDISIENTESDTLSMTITLQKQGGSDIGGSGGGGGGGGSTDYVTTDTEQTITAKKTFTNQVVFTNTLSNGTYVYLLPQESGRLATQEWITSYVVNNVYLAKTNQTNNFTMPQIIDEKVIVHDILDSKHEQCAEYKEKSIHIYRKNTSDNTIDNEYTLTIPSESGIIATREWVKTNATIYVNCGHNYPLTTKLEDVFEYFADHNGRDYIRIITINNIDYIGNIHAGSNDSAVFDLTQIGNGYQNRYTTEYALANPSKTATFNDILVNTYQANFVVEEQAIKVLSSTTSPSGKSEVMFSKSNNAFYRKVNGSWQLLDFSANNNQYGRVILSSENYSSSARNISAIIDSYTPVIGDLVIFLNGYLSTTPYGVKRIMARVTRVSSTPYSVDCPTNIQTVKEYEYDDSDFIASYEDTRTLDTTDFNIIQSGNAIIKYNPNISPYTNDIDLMRTYLGGTNNVVIYSGFDNTTYEIVEMSISASGNGMAYSVTRTPILKKAELDNRVFLPFVNGRDIYSTYNVQLSLADLMSGGFDDTNQDYHELAPNWNVGSGTYRECRFYYCDNANAVVWLVHLLKDTSASPNRYYVYANSLSENISSYVSYYTTIRSELIDDIIDNNDTKIEIGTITTYSRSSLITANSITHSGGTYGGTFSFMFEITAKGRLNDSNNLYTMLFETQNDAIDNSHEIIKKNILDIKLSDDNGEFQQAKVISATTYFAQINDVSTRVVLLTAYSQMNMEMCNIEFVAQQSNISWHNDTLDY